MKKGAKPTRKLVELHKESLRLNELLSRVREAQGRSQNGQPPLPECAEKELALKERARLKKEDLH